MLFSMRAFFFNPDRILSIGAYSKTLLLNAKRLKYGNHPCMSSQASDTCKEPPHPSNCVYTATQMLCSCAHHVVLVKG